MKNSNAFLSRRSLIVSACAGLSLLALGGLTACGGSGAAGSADDSVITVAASPAPHAQILTDFVAPRLAEQGIELKVKEYTDYIQPNKDTASGAVDANYFQHITYLENSNAENGTDLVSAGLIHYEPFAVYAGTSNDLDAIADGATIAIPNDPTNEGRALLLLQDLGLISLSDPDNLEATPKDIKDNPHNIKFQELEAAALPRALSSVDFAVINGNYAIEAGYHVSDALAHESSDSLAVEKYANIICVAKGSEDKKAVRALVEVLTSEDFKSYLEEHYGADVLPAF